MRAKTVFEYDRGDTMRGLRVGSYAPGTPKDFEDVKIGDMAKDYSFGEDWEVIDKTTMKIDLENPPVNEFFPGITDPEVTQFLEQYDESGAMMDFLQHGVTPDMDGEEQDLIACVSTDYGGSAIWIYDDSGALVYW